MVPAAASGCGSQRLFLPAPTVRLHQLSNSAEQDAWAGRCPRSALSPGRGGACIAQAAAAPAETEEAGIRPACYQEVFVAPNPSRLIKDKRAFIEEHR